MDPIFAPTRIGRAFGRVFREILYSLPALFLILAAGAYAEGVGAAPRLKTLDEICAGLEKHDVSGQVLDAKDQPLAGADVFLYYECGAGGLRDRLAGHTKTDAHGAFKFKKALVWEPVTESETRETERVNRYDVIVRHPTHGINGFIINQGDPLEKIRLYLDKPYDHEIRVADLEGKPVQGARVYLAYCSMDFDRSPFSRGGAYHLNRDIGVSSGLSDRAGKVRLPGPRQALFWVAKDGYVSCIASDYGHSNPALLNPSAEISGRVLEEHGAPVPGAKVLLNLGGGVTQTGQDGRYIFKNAMTGADQSSRPSPGQKIQLRPCWLTVEDLRPGSGLAMANTQRFKIGPGEKVVKNVTLGRGVQVAGRVIDETTGRPVPHFKVACAYGAERIDPCSLMGLTDPQGRFRFRVAPGVRTRFSIGDYGGEEQLFDIAWLKERMKPPGFGNLFDGSFVRDTPDLLLKVRLWPAGPLTGRAVDPSGRPVSNILIYLNSESQPGNPDLTGSFTFKLVPRERDFDLLAISQNRDQAGLVHLKAGTTETTITLAPTQSFSGEVRNTEGKPAAGLKFMLCPILNGENCHYDFNEYLGPTHVQTDAAGKFIAPRLCPGLSYCVQWPGAGEEPGVNPGYAANYSEKVVVDLARLKPGEPIRFAAGPAPVAK